MTIAILFAHFVYLYSLLPNADTSVHFQPHLLVTCKARVCYIDSRKCERESQYGSRSPPSNTGGPTIDSRLV